MMQNYAHYLNHTMLLINNEHFYRKISLKTGDTENTQHYVEPLSIELDK